MVLATKAGGRRGCWRLGGLGAGRALRRARRRPLPRAPPRQRLDPLQGGARHHPLVVGPLRLVSTESKQTLVETRRRRAGLGHARPSPWARGPNDTITIVVIGGITYVKGNAGGLESLAGLERVPGGRGGRASGSSSRPTNAAFAQVVAGVRSHDVAKELALKGPLSLGHVRDARRDRRRRHRGDADLRPKSRSTSCSTSAPTAPTCRSRRTRWTRRASPTATEHITYSKWGETVRPEAPQGTVSDRPGQRRLSKRPNGPESARTPGRGRICAVPQPGPAGRSQRHRAGPPGE